MAMLMERLVEVLRGWPNDGARDNYETPLAADTNIHKNGSIVIPTTGGAVTSVSVTGRGDTTALGTLGGVVLKGAGDYAQSGTTNGTTTGSSYAASTSAKDTVLWGNALIRIDSSLANTGWTPAIGDKVTYRGKAATGSTQTGLVLVFDKVGGSDPLNSTVGYVKNVQAAGTGATASTYAVDIVLF